MRGGTRQNLPRQGRDALAIAAAVRCVARCAEPPVDEERGRRRPLPRARAQIPRSGAIDLISSGVDNGRRTWGTICDLPERDRFGRRPGWARQRKAGGGAVTGHGACEGCYGRLQPSGSRKDLDKSKKKPVSLYPTNPCTTE
jgi:hypothetical protein